MGETYIEQEAPLLHSVKAEAILNRTGTVWTAVAHIITAVIGSGVLSLAWSLAQLGWIAGPVAMLAFASITLISAFLLCNCYKSPDPEYGPTRNRTYLDAVEMNLGKKAARVCGICVHIGLYGFTIAYTVTSAISMRAIQKSNCYHKEGRSAACEYGDTLNMILFGVFQILLSQIPDFHNIQWLSIVAAIMSFTYSLIGFGLGFTAVIENGHIKGSIWGVSTSPAEKVWLISQGLGDIAFAYPFSLVLIEIQDTLKSPPAETDTMKKASTISIVISTAFYLLCGGFGYAAFGGNTPGNLLTGFGFYEPYWLIDFANACIVAHLLGGYQLYSQPLFANVEKWFVEKYPNSKYVTDDIRLKLPLLPGFRLSLFRLCFRSLFVVSTTAVAMIFPYFNQIIGVLGGFIYWPLSIYFPVEMYFKQRNIEAWSTEWIVLRTFSLVCLLITTFALIGSIEGLIAAKLNLNCQCTHRPTAERRYNCRDLRAFRGTITGYQCGSPFSNGGAGSPWSQSMCTGSTCTAGDQHGRLHGKLEDENGEESSISNTDCVLWDLSSDDLMNTIV